MRCARRVSRCGGCDAGRTSMSAYDTARAKLREAPRRWLVTGVAGFIGSNLLETLLALGQEVVGLDNFATGSKANLDEVRRAAGPENWARFRFIEGDIRSLEDCRRAVAGTELVLHQAALGSVPRSIADPIATHESNITGFLNMLVAVRDAGVRRFVYASSSSTYGDHPGLPKVEDSIGAPLSPYAVTKYVNELYAAVFARTYGLEPVGLRYFNVFGRRQDPNGPYAAVIPRWADALIANRPVEIFGDGETSRDFCYVDNAVQVNLLAALATDPGAIDQIYNVAVGDRTTLKSLFETLRELVGARYPHALAARTVHRDFRAGDVRHSQADIGRAVERLGYAPTHRVREGLAEAMRWYLAREQTGDERRCA